MDKIGTLLDGFSSLLWPIIVILVIYLFRDAVLTIVESAKSRKFTIKIGDNELTMEEVSKQQRLLINDLQEQVINIGSPQICGRGTGNFPCSTMTCRRKFSNTW
jgi:hypothetical protein